MTELEIELKDKRAKQIADLNKLARERKRDLGKIPEPKNYDLRLKCKDDLLLFFQSYMKDSFPIPFSADHLADIKTIQDCIIHKCSHIR